MTHSYVAGGQVPGPEDVQLTTLELAPPAEDFPVSTVVTGRPMLRRLARTEPVRLWLYPVLVAALGLLVAYGVVSDTVAPAWLALVESLLGVGGVAVIESLRAGVSPAADQ